MNKITKTSLLKNQIPFRVNIGITLEEVKSKYIMEVLKECNENRTRAAKILGVSVRTVQRHLKNV